MKLLAIDTSGPLCSAAVCESEPFAALGVETREVGTGHAEVLMRVIDGALAKAGVQFGNIGRIAVTVGPGSFTGIRIGVATARGLSLALGVPAVGVGVLDALALGVQEAHPGRPVLAVMDAKRGEVYARAFDAVGLPEGPPQAIPPGVLSAGRNWTHHLLTGSGASLLASYLPASARQVFSTASAPDIVAVARLGALMDPGVRPVPLYLRGADAKPQSGFALERQGGPR